MAKLCVVTGGAGFIGSRLAQALIENGNHVRIIDNLSTGKSSNVPKDADFIEADVNLYAEMALAGADIVYHLAANPWVQYAIDHPTEAWRATAESTKSVLWAANHGGVRRVVLASSAAVYGRRRSIRPASDYGRAKLRSEEYCHASPVETVILRFFNVYSHDEKATSAYSRVIPVFLQQALAHEPFTINGDGLQTRDFVHVRDVVRSLIAAGDVPRVPSRPVDVATGRSVSLLELGALVARAAGVKPRYQHKPALRGEARHSVANTRLMNKALKIDDPLSIEEGLKLMANLL